jgi:hypothetical protein
VAEPHRIFTDAGWDITIAAPGNNTPTLDQLSLGISGGVPGKRRDVRRYLEAIAAPTDTKGIVLDDSADPDGLAPSLCSTKTSPGYTSDGGRLSDEGAWR